MTVTPIGDNWYEVFVPFHGTAWFRSHTECAIWALNQIGI